MATAIILDQPAKEDHDVHKFWLVVRRTKSGSESPCGVNTGSGWLMLGTSNPMILDTIREQAAFLGKHAVEGDKIILREYHDYTDLEEF